jgi:ComF family protein
MKKYWESFVQLVLPNICVLCNSYLSNQEKCLCEICKYDLPKFEGFKVSPNHIEKLFWGRVKVQQATSLLQFTSHNQTQTILHQIKYKGNKTLGVEMGKLMGSEILSVDWVQSIDGIIPIPIHIKKMHIRGYNQSDLLAEGMGEVLGKPVLKNLVERTVHTTSQTKLARYERHKNVESIFSLKDKSITGKHYLVIDDVVTTGSTIEACCQTLLEAGVNVSVYTLATTI